MTVKEAAKNWDTISSFIYSRVTGSNKDYVSDDDYTVFDIDASKVIDASGVEKVTGLTRKLMDTDILNSDFSMFEKTPRVWDQLYSVCIADVASNYSIN